MEPSKQKIKFQKRTTNFYQDLENNLSAIITDRILQSAYKLIKIKFIFYAAFYILCYANLFNPLIINHPFLLILNYMFIGLSGILLAFNCSHDAVHNTFSNNKTLNRIIYYVSFNLQGTNSKLWKRRHLHSHHLFPNVDGCDADIDDNPFIRLSASQPFRKHHRFQHMYAIAFYCLYTLHWIFMKDFLYLRKKQVANMTNNGYPFSFWVEVISLKLFYISSMIAIPCYFTALPLTLVVTAFIIMHVFISIFFVLTLIISHLTMETAFPKWDTEGYLPTDYHAHQLAVSLDYHPTSKIANWIFGGFNSHAAHHLFPKLPHTIYPLITPAIVEMTKKYGLPYNEKTMWKAILSHFQYLKKLSHQ